MLTIFKQFSYLRLNILEVLEKEKNKEQLTLCHENRTADGKALVKIIAGTMQQQFSAKEQSK